MLLACGAAQATCDENNWKPWMTASPIRRSARRGGPTSCGAPTEAGSTNWFTKPEVVKRGLAEVSRSALGADGNPAVEEAVPGRVR
jgi:hypothetical protein